jgi:hypothetical protein
VLILVGNKSDMCGDEGDAGGDGGDGDDDDDDDDDDATLNATVGGSSRRAVTKAEAEALAAEHKWVVASVWLLIRRFMHTYTACGVKCSTCLLVDLQFVALDSCTHFTNKLPTIYNYYLYHSIPFLETSAKATQI